MSPMPIRVAVVSPQEVVAAGLRSLLTRVDPSVTVVRLGSTTAGAAPDVVVYDVVGLEDDDGEELSRLVHRTPSAVVVVAREQRPELVVRALELGADGAFPLEVDQTALLAAVRAADAGEPTVGDAAATGQVSMAATATFDQPARWDPVPGLPAAAAIPDFSRLKSEVRLSDRELDVLRLITQGLTNVEIAERSFLSINSVKSYIRGAYRRIGVSTRSQAVVWCLQRGFPARADASVEPGLPA